MAQSPSSAERLSSPIFPSARTRDDSCVRALFGDVNWSVIYGTDGDTYGNVSGDFFYNNKPARALIQLRLPEGGRFQLAAYERDGKAQNWNALSALLDAIHMEYGGKRGNAENGEFEDIAISRNFGGNSCCPKRWRGAYYTQKRRLRMK